MIIELKRQFKIESGISDRKFYVTVNQTIAGLEKVVCLSTVFYKNNFLIKNMRKLS